ncbi:MAG: succinylglutamate desuccinylase/aspartoacylase family protein [Saprospiraceae bacterium]|nr:MAG: succinylglutamate desuccinylase/aspartoacylase family protein [Saprospiraceae bacterium]
MTQPHESEKKVPVITTLPLNDIPACTIQRFYLHIVSDGMGLPVYLPVIIAKGNQPGEVLGLTAAVHGNELNGIPVIQRIFKEINVNNLKGTIVGVPIVNVPSLVRRTRRFIDGTDLNHIMPGQEYGNVSSIYAWRLMDRVVKHFNYLIDLHTASFGRINSYYIRADMQNPVTQMMATLQNPQIILHNPPSDGTLRGAAHALGIHAITLEVGNPYAFQRGMIRDGLTGIHNLLHYLGMIKSVIEQPDVQPILCKDSKWIYTRHGGLLTVLPDVATMVKKDQPIARIKDVFGDLRKEYYAPEDGIVIGKEVNPVNQTGGRMLHLGIVGETW